MTREQEWLDRWWAEKSPLLRVMIVLTWWMAMIKGTLVALDIIFWLMDRAAR